VVISLSSHLPLIVIVNLIVVVVVVALVHRLRRRRWLLLDPRTLGRLVLLGALDRAAVPLEAVVAASDLLGADGVGNVVVALGGCELGRGATVVVPDVELGPVTEEDLGDVEVAFLCSAVEGSVADVVGAVPVAALVQ